MNMPIRQSERQHIIRLPDGERFQLRYVRPDDQARLEEMFSHASPEDIRFRLLGAVRGFAAHMAERFAHLDPERDAAIVATSLPDSGPEEIYGIVHIGQDTPQSDTAEYDVMVRSDFKAHGLGYRLMTEILQCARRRGLRAVTGYISPDNGKMLLMAEELGFVARRGEGNVVEVRLDFAEFDKRLEEGLASGQPTVLEPGRVPES
ncbi:GCN5-related N-acetyltransferase [Methylocella silvestris BL2]|uniref:GCN5-related N-acetyltransferase n=1 Tax=Methylocella silvestris (strain DSM 15510 / CIP 108128 / LMG 27833 / NCIMB 13906 / BL2) TaxID=395965 RepID=B8EQF2_METSB|nr:GNAT family N-acetyltransferase [Methylocella silvestris]ACK52165.1 GCN5-related N-acetyltransferase [Methylocella silvestris BL2]